MAQLPNNLPELQQLGKPITTAQNTAAQGYIANTYGASDSESASYAADQRQVNQTNDTVEGRLDGLLSKGSPFMQRAETTALQQANSRGLLNSSMAVGAAQNAVIDAALPIATQDASAMNQQRLANQSAVNQSSRDNAGFTQQTNLANQTADNQARQYNATAQNAVDGAEQSQNYRQDSAKLEADLNQVLKQQGYNQDIGLKSLDQEFELGKLDATVYANTKGEYLNAMMDLVKNSAINISEVQKAADITQADKTAMVDQQLAMRDTDIQFLQTLYGSIDTWSQGWSEL